MKTTFAINRLSKVLIGLLLLFCLNGNAQWTSVLTGSNSFFVGPIQFTNDSVGYVIDWYGVYKTSNHGLSWSYTKLIYTLTPYFVDLYFASEDTGFIVTYTGDIYKTTNSGSSWGLIYQFNSATFDNKLFFNSPTSGFYGNSTGEIYKTTDGGSTWIMKYKLNDAVTGIYVNKNGNGIIASETKAYRTTDGGNSWSLSTLPGLNYNSSLQLFDDGTGYAAYQDNLYKTVDNGLNWTVILNYTGCLYNNVQQFSFLNADTGYVSRYYYNCGEPFYKTYDGGITWDTIQFNYKDSVDGLWFTGSDTGYVVGVYEIYKIAKNGNSLVSDSVWPGDANNDKIANVYDVLPIGIAYNSTGNARTNASNNWVGQACTDWSQSFSNNENYKYADCDGNGTIDLLDIAPIGTNYGLTHNKTQLVSNATAADPDLYLEFNIDTTGVQTQVKAKIMLGKSQLPLNAAYGFAFSISYNNSLVDSGSMNVDFSNSWLASSPNYISLVKDNYSEGRIDIGFSRIDQQSISGYGEVGELDFFITDNIDGKDTLFKTLTLTPYNLVIIDDAENDIPVNALADSLVITQIGTGITSINKNNVSVFCNSNKQLIINAKENIIQDVIIADMVGKCVLYQNFNEVSLGIISMKNLSSGIYFLQVKTNEGSIIKKFQLN